MDASAISKINQILRCIQWQFIDKGPCVHVVNPVRTTGETENFMVLIGKADSRVVRVPDLRRYLESG